MASAARNPALLLEVLTPMLARRGVGLGETGRKWIDPPAIHVASYVDQVGHVPAYTEEARARVEAAMRREPGSAPALSAFAGLAWRDRDFSRAALARRLATCLSPEVEHYARQYAWTLRRAGHRDEAVAHLERRAHSAAGFEAARPEPWITWLEVLIEDGRPARAREAAEQLLKTRGEDGRLAAELAPVLARFGRDGLAERAVQAAEKAGARTIAIRARVRVDAVLGRPERALDLARAWCEAEPARIDARSLLLRLYAQIEGSAASLALARRWVQEAPHDQGYEELLLEELARSGLEEERTRRLRRRLEDDALDGWTWRELAIQLATEARRASGDQRARLVEELAHTLERCEATDPHSVVNLALRGRLAELRWDLDEALEHYAEAMRREPGYSAALRMMLDLAGRLGPRERESALVALDHGASVAFGPVDWLRDAILWIGHHVGVEAATAALARWTELIPDPAGVLEAHADLLLQYVGGITGAERAVALLEPRIDEFPLHRGLRLSLARAYLELDRQADAVAEFARVCQANPEDTYARVELARALRLRGDVDAAIAELADLCETYPGANDASLAYIELLHREGRHDEALAAAVTASERQPSSLALTRARVSCLFALGRRDEILSLLDARTASFPRDAALAGYRAGTLVDLSAPAGEVDEAWARAAELDAGSVELAIDHANWLVGQGRAADALARLDAHAADTRDPLPLWLQRARTLRGAGESAAATSSLCDLLARHPYFEDRWSTYMDWAVEDEARDHARDFLDHMSPRLERNAVLQARRLQVLEWAGTPLEALEERWRALLASHGNEPDVVLYRGRRLIEQGRGEEVEALLGGLVPADRSHELIELMRLRALASTGRGRGLLEPARALWERRELGEFTSRRLAAVLVQVGLVEEVAGELVDAVGHGAPVAGEFLAAWTGALAEQRHGQTLARLLDAATDSRHEARSEWLAWILDALTTVGGRLVPDDWVDAHLDEVRRHDELWEVALRALLASGRVDDVLALGADFETRTRAHPWALVNYLVCCSKREAWARLAAAARWTIRELAPDRHTKTAVLFPLRADLALRDWAQFEQDWDELAEWVLPPDKDGVSSYVFQLGRRGLTVSSPWELRALHSELRRFERQHERRGHIDCNLVRALLSARMPPWMRALLKFEDLIN